jgi:hypothetical protein
MAKSYLSLGARNMCEQWVKVGKNAINWMRLSCAKYKTSVLSTFTGAQGRSAGLAP